MKEEHITLFKRFERDLEIRIPDHLKHLLILCGYDNMFCYVGFCNDDIKELEKIARANATNNPSLSSIFYPYFIDKKNYKILPAFQRILLALGKYATYKTEDFTFKKFNYK